MDELEIGKAAESMANDIIRDVTYIFGIFVPPEAGNNRLDRLKQRIPPADRKRIDFTGNALLAELAEKEFITPYDVLSAEITGRVRQFYGDIALSSQALHELEKYGARSERFKTQFAERVNAAADYAVTMVIKALDRSILQNKDVKGTADEIAEAVKKRAEAAQAMVTDSYRQMLVYMVLWEYQDQGFSQYQYIAKDENCSTCSGLDGQVFSIDAAQTGENLAPMHPNCDCVTGILDGDGKVILTIGQDGFQSGAGDDAEPVHWYTPLLRIPEDAWTMWNAMANAEYERFKNITGPLSFLDWMTYGLVSSTIERGQVMLNDPSLYHIANWLTMGGADMVQGAFMPEEPLSLTHWLDSFGTVTAGYGAYQAGKRLLAGEKIDIQNKIDSKQGNKELGIDEMVVSDSKYLNSLGDIDWEKYAPNGGYIPNTKVSGKTIQAGTIIDRYGSYYGKYVSPVGIPYEQRSLPYFENVNAYHKYEVLKPINNVTQGKISAAFGQIGGGIQYELPATIKDLIRDGFLKEIK